MRSLQNAIAVLLVLLATGSAAALAAEPAGVLATEPAAAIEITYSYSNDPSTAKPLNGVLVNGPFYIFFDPGLPDDTFEAIFWIDRKGTIFDRPVGTSSTPPFSIRYDPSSLSYGPHRLYVLYETRSSPGHGSVEAYFSVGGELGEVKFTVLSDAHICNPYYPPNWPPFPVPPPPTKWPCQYKTEKDHKKARLEDAVRRTALKDVFWVSLGDAIEDLYFEHDKTTPHYYFKYVSDLFSPERPPAPHYTVLGNHDIRDYGKSKSIHLEDAKDLFQQSSDDYHVGPFIREAGVVAEALPSGWTLYLLHSGEEVESFGAGSCVRFSNTPQLDDLEKLLANSDLPDKSVILFWHVSPESEIRNTDKDICKDTKDRYLEILHQHAGKIKAIITGHVHNAKSYVWTTEYDAEQHYYGPVENNDTHDFNPVYPSQIMMITAPSTGYPPEHWDSEKYPDLFLEVSLHSDGTLKIDNKNSVPWVPIDLSEPPTPVFGESSYTQADSCFEQDNDGDGWFNDDKIDCPSGTYMGTALDYNQQIHTIEAELRQSCKVRNYIPGEYDAVSSFDVGETALENLIISQHYEACTKGTPPISKLNSKRGGRAVAVVVAGPDGVARQIANANTRDYTDETSGMSVVFVEHNDRFTEAHLENVPEDYQVSLHVNFEPGLTGEFIPDASSCNVETSVWLDDFYPEDPAFAEYFGLEVVDSNTPPAPSLSRPPDGAGTCDLIPSFAWDPVSEVTAYQIQVDDDDDFSSAEIDSEVSGTSFSPAAPLPAGGYHWRVRAAYDCGHGAWSSTWSFKQLSCLHLPVVTREN